MLSQPAVILSLGVLLAAVHGCRAKAPAVPIPAAPGPAAAVPAAKQAAGRRPEPLPRYRFAAPSRVRYRIRFVRNVATPAGNGLEPLLAAYDTRRRLIYTINRKTNNLSVIDYARRRVVRTVPCRIRWDDLNRWGAAFYDARSDRLILALLGAFEENELLSLSGGSLRVLGARTVKNAAAFGASCQYSPLRQELYLTVHAGPEKPWQLHIYDSHSLRPKRRMRLRKPVWALASDDKSGLLYAAESVSVAAPATEMQMGPARIIAIDTSTGKIIRRSSTTYGVPRQIFLDSAHRLVILDGGDWQPALKFAGADTLRYLGGHRIQFPPGRRQGDMSDMVVQAEIDPSRRRLVLLTDGGQIGSVGLSPTSTVRLSGEVIVDREGAIDPSLPGGGILLVVGNTVRVVDGRTLRERWHICPGADIRQVFADTNRHRLLVYARTDPWNLWWVERKGIRPLFRSRPFTRLDEYAQPVAVDFARSQAYGWMGTHGPEVGRAPFGGAAGRSFKLYEEGLHLLVPGVGRDVLYAVVRSPEMAENATDARVDVYKESSRVRTIPIGRAPAGVVPLPGREELCLVYDDHLRLLSGLRIPFRMRATRPHDTAGAPYHAQVLADRDAEGKHVYWLAAGSRLLHKVRLSDGREVAECLLPFPPVSLAADTAAGYLYLADWRGGRIVAIQAF